jgi:MoxR-like ATPase
MEAEKAGVLLEEDRLEAAAEVASRLLANIETVVYGKTEEIRLVLAALACGGHVLLEDVPGTSKTVLARAIAASVEDAVPTRIQCTPDLQPTDVTGLSVFNQRTRDFEFRPGPIFANVVLVDEINRAMPKTQSALLEAMAEQQVTVDGVTRRLPDPFLLIATENPIEYEGTFPLPEAQLDRFFLKTGLGYPGVGDELKILEEQRFSHPLGRLGPVVGIEEIHDIRRAAQHIYIDDLLRRWLVDLVRATRELDDITIGG